MTQWEDWIGREVRTTDTITCSLLDRYNATVGVIKGAGDVHAPLGMHWCLCVPSTSVSELGIDGHPKKGKFLPPIPLPRRMWASSFVEFLKPLRISDNVVRDSRIKSIKEKIGSTGVLVFVDVVHRTFVDNIECVRETQTLVYREKPSIQLILPQDSGFAKLGEGVNSQICPTTAHLFRYSALTFNSHRIHYDAPYALQKEGYPALVVQGPFMASLMLQFASTVLGAENIRQFSFRGHAPAYCDQELHLKMNKSGAETAWLIHGADGRKVMSGNINTRPNLSGLDLQ
ncbi:MAG: hypothetical protein COA43_01050 [Robiginitomaculum sp.]|nr:MAG: hypothetical protein COA43_01050 [Robiginitomaculum sp.]